jgi:hypothetical protein
VALVCAAALCGALAQSAVAAEAPQVAATWVTDVTASSANLRAQINPKGTSTTYRFQYISQAAYQANLNAVPPKEGFAGAATAPPGAPASIGAGTSPVAVLQHVTGLSPSTIYRYRALATSHCNPGEPAEECTTIGPERALGTQETSSVFRLLDNRGWEMVSPVDKNGGSIQPPEGIFGGGVFQAAAGGGSLTYSSADSFGADPAGAPPGSQYIARRGGSGWVTENISEPLQSGAYGDEPDGVPYQLFSLDLARGLLLDRRDCASEPCTLGYALRESATGALTQLPEAPDLHVLSASPDLGRIVFESEGNLYEWSGGGLVPTSLLPAAAGPGAAFQVSSADGRFVFYTEGGHLYRYDAVSEAADDLTPSGGVQGVLGASADGSRAYYLDAAGIELWRQGLGSTQIAPGASAAAPGSYPPATGTARVSPDGSHLLFLSAAELTGFENNGAMEAFLYGPPPGGGAATLTCISCNPSGERPQGAASIPGAVANGQGAGATRAYKPHALSEDGSRAFFDSADDLVLQDTNGQPDVYEWEAQGVGGCAREGGCIGLISSGRSGAPSSFVDASADDTDVFFLTEASLAFGDPGSFDLYDARVGGGFPVPPNAIACEGDACQALPEAPEDPKPGTLVRNAGNPALHVAKQRVRKHRRHRRHRRQRHKPHRHRHGGRR